MLQQRRVLTSSVVNICGLFVLDVFIHKECSDHTGADRLCCFAGPAKAKARVRDEEDDFPWAALVPYTDGHERCVLCGRSKFPV